jgi:hypothetical protein
LRKQLENGERANCLQKFADAIGVNGAALKYEFEHFLPIASKFAHVEGLENFHAWRKAIRCTQKNRMAHSAEALIPALARLGCWSCSSSGCELGFSVAQNVKQLGQSQDENINSKEVLLILQQDIMTSSFSEAEEQKLISAASKLWSQHCSRVRTTGSSKRVQRWDKNIPRTGSFLFFSVSDIC